MPLQDHLSEDVKSNKQERVLSKVKEYIDNNLHPRKRNIFNPYKKFYEEVPSIKEIIEKLDISQEEYYSTLEVSCNSEFQIHIQHKPNACFVNNYFVEGLLVWQASIDIQLIFNHYKAVTYMCACFSKAEEEALESINKHQKKH